MQNPDMELNMDFFSKKITKSIGCIFILLAFNQGSIILAQSDIGFLNKKESKVIIDAIGGYYPASDYDRYPKIFDIILPIVTSGAFSIEYINSDTLILIMDNLSNYEDQIILSKTIFNAEELSEYNHFVILFGKIATKKSDDGSLMFKGFKPKSGISKSYN